MPEEQHFTRKTTEEAVPAESPGSGDPVAGALHAGLGGAAGAAEEAAARLDAVADDLTSAVPALGSQGVDGAFEAVEDVRLSRDLDLEGFVVIVSADFADCHGVLHRLPPQYQCHLS